jgi:hypothetical protein
MNKIPRVGIGTFIILGLVFIMNTAKGMTDGTVIHKEIFIPQLFQDVNDAFMTTDRQPYEQAVVAYNKMSAFSIPSRHLQLWRAG